MFQSNIFWKSHSRTGPATVRTSWARSSFTFDFLIPVEKVRQEAKRIVEASKLWDQRVFAFQVTDFRSNSVEIRILASAKTSPELFDLRCEIREKILSFLQDRYPSAFPRVRTALSRLLLNHNEAKNRLPLKCWNSTSLVISLSGFRSDPPSRTSSYAAESASTQEIGQIKRTEIVQQSRLRAISVSLFVLLLEFNRHRLKAIRILAG